MTLWSVDNKIFQQFHFNQKWNMKNIIEERVKKLLGLGNVK